MSSTTALPMSNETDRQALLAIKDLVQRKLPTNITRWSNIKEINLIGNNLGGEIPVSVSSMSSLTRLSLSRNNFRGSIPASFGNLSELSVLSLAENKLIGSIPFELGRLFKLRFLQLSLNNLTGMVPTQLYNMSSLRVVGLAFIPDLGLALPELQLFSGNNFSGLLPHSIANLSKFLNALDIRDNYISGSIHVGIEKLLNLQLFSVEENMLSGSIPESIGKLSKLEQIYMYTNKFSGNIPSSIGNLSQLSILSLFDNKLEERIPDSLGNCKRLVGINLSSNNLTGTIPGQIFELSSLSIGLFLARNQLTGPIPTQIGNLRNLEKLVLSENKLSGGIPTTLSSEVPIDGLFKNVSAFSVVGNRKLCGGVEELQLPACPANVLQKKKGPLNNKVIIPNMVGEEMSTQGDMYSYGVLLLVMFIGKRPTDCMFSDTLSLSGYTKRFLPNKILDIVDPQIILEEERHPSRTRETTPPSTNKLEVCLVPVLQIGVLCCAARPNERMNARDVLAELHKIRNVFFGASEQGRQHG
ncbi:hypothetical protein RHGRI_020448 [Rhododendron griersonianum]|uniref:Leucine-rich repeat receptor-like protein kinase n=1 Tax=Rhododendron griersonianum TaxID=479676 RepID=A0AAV6JKC7_9ERIC|nr:hypothetical protein RHGRI_020448 [Rhododendron griersonianum]